MLQQTPVINSQLGLDNRPQSFLLQRDVLHEIVSGLHVDVVDDLLVVGLAQLQRHGVDLALDIVLEHDGVDGVLHRDLPLPAVVLRLVVNIVRVQNHVAHTRHQAVDDAALLV